MQSPVLDFIYMKVNVFALYTFFGVNIEIITKFTWIEVLGEILPLNHSNFGPLLSIKQ